MPILWPTSLQGPLGDSGNLLTMAGDIAKPIFALPPAIGGKWRGMPEYSERGDAGLLYRQKQKLEADWKVVLKAFPNRNLSEYIYYWLIVNTRSFYFDALGGQTPKSCDDRMVLCPFVDYFNHNDSGVSLNRTLIYVVNIE